MAASNRKSGRRLGWKPALRNQAVALTLPGAMGQRLSFPQMEQGEVTALMNTTPAITVLSFENTAWKGLLATALFLSLLGDYFGSIVLKYMSHF